MIAAIGRNGELGADNGLLWDIPDDLAYFRHLTAGKVVIMGRKTYDSLPEAVRPLPGRVNIVILRSTEASDFKAPPEVILAHSPAEAIDKAKQIALTSKMEEIFVIGGASIYEQSLSLTDRLYVTEIDADFPEADVFFPKYKEMFPIIINQRKSCDDNFSYSFRILER